MIGSGQFGKVHQGEWEAPGTKVKVEVALKTLKEGASEEDKVKFLQEAAIMGQFSHPNVVKLHGLVTEGEPVRELVIYRRSGNFRRDLFSCFKFNFRHLTSRYSAKEFFVRLIFTIKATGERFLMWKISRSTVHKLLSAANLS